MGFAISALLLLTLPQSGTFKEGVIGLLPPNSGRHLDDSNFSPDGRNCAFVRTNGKQSIISLGFWTSQRYDWIGLNGGITADGKHVGYVAGKGNQLLVCVDDQVVARHDSKKVYVKRIALSGDGKTVAYQAGDTTDRSEWVVINGKSGPKFEDGIGWLNLSADGKHSALQT